MNRKMTKCLACKSRMHADRPQPYGGDFCSEFCFSTYPGIAARMQRHDPARYKPSDQRGAVDRILQQNRDILKAFREWHNASPTMADIGSLQWLRQTGFSFDYHTPVLNHSDGGTEVWCYDAGYRLERDGAVHPI